MHYAINNKYPIETAGQVKTASQYFTRNLSKIEPASRVTIASNLEKRASDLNVDIREGWITNYSRMTKISKQISPTFNSNLMTRKEAMSNDIITIDGNSVSASETLDKIAQLKEEGASGDLLVNIIDEFDKVANLKYSYDVSVPDSILTVYGNLSNPEFDAVKVAESLTDYDVKRLSNNEDVLVKIASVLGNDVASSFSNTPLTALMGASGLEKDALIDILTGDK